MTNNGPVTTRPRSSRDVVSPAQTTNLADLLERVLDKGIVIAGDITLFLGGVQLLTLRIRLLVASIDKAQEIGQIRSLRGTDDVSGTPRTCGDRSISPHVVSSRCLVRGLRLTWTRCRSHLLCSQVHMRGQ